MSTIVKKIVQLPMLSQILVLFILVFVIVDLILLKMTLRWWRKTVDSLSKQSQIKKINQDKNTRQSKVNNDSIDAKINLSWLLSKVLQSYSPMEPCLHNLSANKFPVLFLIQLWIYLLIFTSISDHLPSYSSSIAGVAERTFKFCALLGWGLTFLTVLDSFLRYITAKSALQNIKLASVQTIQIQTSKMPKIGRKKQINLCAVSIYYTILSIASVSISFLAIIQIFSNQKLSKNQLGLSTKLNQINIDNKVITILLDLLITFVCNQVIMIITFGIVALILWFFQVKVEEEFGYFLQVAYGVKVKQNRKVHIQQQMIAQVQESKQNIGHATDRNHIENLIFTQPNQQSQKSYKIVQKKQKSLFNTPQPNEEKLKYNPSGTRKKRKQIFLTQSQLNLSQVKAKIQKFQAKKKQILEKKSKSIEINPMHDTNKSKLIASLQNNQFSQSSKTEKKKSKMFFNQDALQEEETYEEYPDRISSNQKKENKKSRLASLFIHSESNQQQEYSREIEKQVEQFQVLGNIQNRVSACDSFKKKKRMKGQLRIVDCAQNQIQIQAIDLSKYAIKNLGYVQSKTIDYKPAVSRFKKKSILPPLNLATPSNKKQKIKIQDSSSSLSNKKKMIKSPSVADTPADGFTFCLHDIKHHASSE